MPRLQRKGFGSPDEIRRIPNGVVEIVMLDEIAVSRFTFQPGWRWLEDVGPIAKTPTCQHRHVGYTISGRLTVRMDDGTTITIQPGDAYEIPAGHLAWVEGDAPWESVEFTSGHAYGKPPDDLGERVLATIVFSDICDSTAALERMGDKEWTRVVREHNARIRTVIDRFRGREITTLGDGFLALFDGAAKAVMAAAAMDLAVADLAIRVRAGVHTGEVAIVGGQARGVAVHAAARVAALAGPGEVLASGTTHDLLDGSGLSFESRGAHELKGLSGARPIFALVR
jgi:class 3 adenylate cyclase/quercetin dioxygenase-like cupin family protein